MPPTLPTIKGDVFDGKFNHVKSFTDRAIPAGVTAFGIRDLDGLLYVSYARSHGGDGGLVRYIRRKPGVP